MENDGHIDKRDKTAARVVTVVDFYLQIPTQSPISLTSETGEKRGRMWGGLRLLALPASEVG